MEVHHHPHVEKKTFKEYFLEFLMIFLAVTMGFFAETIRESLVEKNQERNYIQSFYIDISSDVQQLPKLAQFHNIQIKFADSLILLLDSANVKTPANRIYYFAKYAVRQAPLGFFITERTVTQLKNSGGYRLIHDQKLSDSIIDYYKTADEIKFLQGWLQGYKQTLEQNYSSILRGSSYHKMIDVTDKVIEPTEKIYLKDAEKNAINNCILQISEIQGLTTSVKMHITELNDRAVHLKEYIEKEYHFENK
jgi:hypothetical protein